MSATEPVAARVDAEIAEQIEMIAQTPLTEYDNRGDVIRSVLRDSLNGD